MDDAVPDGGDDAGTVGIGDRRIGDFARLRVADGRQVAVIDRRRTDTDPHLLRSGLRRRPIVPFQRVYTAGGGDFPGFHLHRPSDRTTGVCPFRTGAKRLRIEKRPDCKTSPPGLLPERRR